MMTDEDILQQLRELNYPDKIDVVDAVMAQVRNKPLLVPQPKHVSFQRWAIAVAACFVLAVTVNVSILFLRDFNEPQLSKDIAMVYNYTDAYNSISSDDSYDFGLVEYLYDE